MSAKIIKLIATGILFSSLLSACWEKKEEAATTEPAMEQTMEQPAEAPMEEPAEEMNEQPEETPEN